MTLSSINTAHKKRDGHLKYEDFFDASTFPNIEFTPYKIDGNYDYGNLLIHV